jgi:hypothetical protein
MHFKTFVLAGLTALPTFAFTNGSLVPAYICKPKVDGLPKSFGQLLQYTREPTTKVGFNTNGLFLSHVG